MSKKYPSINFGINLSLEKRFFSIFRDPQMAIRPELEFLLTKEFKTIKQKVLIAYIDNFYRGYEQQIQQRLKQTAKDWKSLNNYFFQEVDKLFHQYPWPQGNYRGYLSIWWMFPRFIQEKIFTFPYAHSNPTQHLKVIVHEMLHFITYDYLIKKYHLNPAEHSSRNNLFWQFTENLNVLIEREKFWLPFTGGKLVVPYKDCQALYTRMEKIWQHKKDIDFLVKNIFKV